MRVIGLMSGTSLDGVDAALVRIGPGDAGVLSWQVLGFVTVPYTPEQRLAIQQAIAGAGPPDLCRLHGMLGEWLAAAALEVCQVAGVSVEEVDLIGSHGQTVWHEPPDKGARGTSLQLGCAATIAERTGVPVVSDFRSRDMAAGGQGAPLVTWADRVLFAKHGRRRALQNIGGMANVTWLPRPEDGLAPFAFDTGPGMALVDAAAELASDGKLTYDRDGCWAARGRVQESLLQELLAHPFLSREPPKSTGREVFGQPYVLELVNRVVPGNQQAWADLIVTLVAFTARSIGHAYRQWVLPRGVDEVFLAGGGARHPVLRRLISQELAPVPVLPAHELGLDPDARESVAFAVLAWAHAQGKAGNVPGATGARGGRVLGSYTPGRLS